MRPILAINCLLQIEQERSEEETSVGYALALAFRRTHFSWDSLVLFAPYSSAFLCGLATLLDPVQSVNTTLVSMLNSLREALRLSLYRFF